MSMLTPLARVRGLGSANEGAHHWWMQRLTAVALVPLLIWFVASLAFLAGADHARVTAWIGHPVVAVLLLLMLFALFYHLKLGMQVVIEDYVHGKFAKLVLLLGNSFGTIVLGAACGFAVLKIAFGGS